MDKKYENLIINQHNLDYEVVRQSQTFFEVGTAAAEAKSKRDALYEAYKRGDAELNVSVRQELNDSGVKYTEAVVTAKVQTHPDHLMAYDLYLQAALETDKLTVLKEAWANRAYMLRDLITLFSANYFTADAIKATNNQDEIISSRKNALTQNRKPLRVTKEV